MLPTPSGSWIQTYTGGKFWPLDPDPALIRIEDIAHALSNQCRFTGHVREFYSIAQHSVLVSMLAKNEHKLWGLMHDASEAYICDLARPVKYDPRLSAYKEIEKRIQAAIVEKFGLFPAEEPEEIKAIDRALLFTERRDLLSRLEADNWGMGLKAEPLPYTIIPWTPKHAEEMFLRYFEELKK